MYRTKMFKYLMKMYLEPIMKFEGISLKNEDGLNYLVEDGEDHESAQFYLADPLDENKKLAFVMSENEFIKYKSVKDTITFFNPLAKYKNMIYLVQICIPTLYSVYCKNSDSMEDLVNNIVDDTILPSQSEISNYINFQQSQIVKNAETGENIYTYRLSLRDDSDDVITFESSNTNKIIALIILMLKILEEFDIDVPEIVKNNQSNYDLIAAYLESELDAYFKERQLNAKDMRKLKQTNSNDIEFVVNAEDSEENISAGEDVETLINTSETEQKNKNHDQLIDLMQGIQRIPFNFDEKGTDQSFSNLEFI